MGTIVIRNNPSGRSTTKGVSIAHEYGLLYSKSESAVVGRLPRNEKQDSRYKEVDEVGKFEWVNFRKHGGMKSDAPSMYYPIFISGDTLRIPDMEFNEISKEWLLKEEPRGNEVVIYPIDEHGLDRRWKWGIDRFKNELKNCKVSNDKSGKKAVYIKARMNEEGVLPMTWWDQKEYSATAYGTNLLKTFFKSLDSFSYPKALNLSLIHI